MSRTPWFICSQPRPDAALRLFCLPYAGGSASIFRSWAELLPPSIELYAIQLPGREQRWQEAPFTTMHQAVEALVTHLTPHFAEKPFALFGHSMGGTMAFESAHLLATTHPPVHLLVGGQRAPHLAPLHPPLHTLPDSAFAQELQMRYQGIPRVIFEEPELLSRYLPMIRADFTLIESYQYQPRPPLALPLTLFGGTLDPTIREADLAAWQHHTSGPFARHMLMGDHFFLNTTRAPLLELVSRALTYPTENP